jgi:hypothetical protein
VHYLPSKNHAKTSIVKCIDVGVMPEQSLPKTNVVVFDGQVQQVAVLKFGAAQRAFVVDCVTFGRQCIIYPRKIMQRLRF